MTELVASVRLKADGSGLVGQANAAAAAVKGVGGAAAGATGEARAFAGATAGAEASVRGLAAGAAAADRAVDQLGAAARVMAGEQRQVAAAVGTAGDQLARYGRQARDAANDNARNAFGLRNFGQQVGDLAIMIQGGISPARAFATQAGQMGYALSEMGGAAGKVGTFLTGPWGIALTIAVTTLAPFVEKMFEGGSAADEFVDKLSKTAEAADTYGAAQTLLGKFVDLSTGKIKTQNVALIQQIRLLAEAQKLAARNDQRTATTALRELAAPTLRESVTAGLTGTARRLADPGYKPGTDAANLKAGLAPLDSVVSGFVRLTEVPNASPAAIDRGYLAALRSIAALDRRGKLGGRDRLTAENALNQLRNSIDAQRQNQVVVDVANGGKLPDYLRQDTKKRGSRSKSTDARDEFGRDAASRIAGLTERFDETPEALRRANAEVRQLDDLIDDLARKKPVGFDKLIADAEAAKVTIRNGLIAELGQAFEKPRTLADQAAVAFGQLNAVAADLEKRRPAGWEEGLARIVAAKDQIAAALNEPFDDFMAAQAQSLQLGQLAAEGRTAEADSLRTIVQLERQRGPLSDAQKAAILASNQALQAQERQIERLQRRQQIYLNAIGDVQSIVRQTIYDGPAGLKNLPSQLVEAARRFKSDKIAEQLFGDVFDDLRDQVRGTTIVEDAAQDMATAVGGVTRSTTEATDAVTQFASALRGATPAAAAGVGADGPLRDASGAPSSDLLSKGAAVVFGTQIGDVVKDIVVRGQRDPFTSSFSRIATVLAEKIGIDDDRAKAIGRSIGDTASRGLQGAAVGALVSDTAKVLGINLNRTGSQIGGAIGGATGLPGGELVGSIWGGAIGKLFEKPKYGTAALTSNDNEAIGLGRGSAAGRAATGMGMAVQEGLAAIAQQLGGTLGNYAVSIGTYKDKIRVSTTGYTGRLGNQGSKTGALGIVDFGQDEAGAVAYAILDAVKDGAVQGLSAAVQKALQSSTDPQKGVAEALKVQALETLLGGVSGQLTAVFRQFDYEAKERVRLARQYGLDLLQVEKINAEQRADLISETIIARTQPLRDLLTSLTTGDLFEGSASDRRTALLAEAAKARADTDLGKEGAADRLASLLGQLVSTSREAFGTAGPEYTNDRELARVDAERVIRAEEDRVRAAAGAQEATTRAVEQVGALTGEGNDYLAEMDRTLRRLEGTLLGLLAASEKAATVKPSVVVNTPAPDWRYL